LPGAVLFDRIRLVLAGHGRGHLTGCDRVDRDPVLRQLQRHHLGQQPETTLGRAVGARTGQRHVLVHRRHVDDPSRGAGLDHQSRRLLPAHERPGQIGLDDGTPLVEIDLEER
jgi:hypothetical protein